MKKRLSLLALALCSATMPAAYASPKVGGAKKSFSRILTGESARSLFSSLGLPETQSGESQTKQFIAENIRIDCRQREDLAAACAVSVMVAEEAETAATAIYGEEAKILFDALLVPQYEGRVSDGKMFTDADEITSIQCSRSLIPNGDRYACSAEISPR